MGSLLVGHVAIGLGFLLIGLWHLFNHIKLHSLHPKTYISLPWFPTPTFHYLEPVLISICSALYIAMELFVTPSRHQPLDNDWTIPSYHLHNFEHALISLNFIIYALFSIIFDRVRMREPHLLLRLMQVISSVVFFQEFILLHLHTTNHAGLEGQYHWLLQIIIVISFVTSFLGIGLPKSFIVSFVRSVSIAFQGLWFIAMGFALWEPGFVPKGCLLELDEYGRTTVKCKDRGSLDRAKALANLGFSMVLACVMIFSMVVYLVLTKWYCGECEYIGLDHKLDDDLELQREGENEEFCPVRT